MKRRDLIRYTILSSTSLAGIFHQNFANAKSFELKAAQSKYRWIVLYWMPYDNNLVRFGEQIIEMLIEGTKNSDAIVVVQSDYFGDVHMRRRIIENGIIEQENLEIEDSSNVDTFSAYLDWAFQTFDAEKWAIIIVGHGGRINEISPDNHGFNRQPRTWMEVDQLAREISHFNRSTDNRVELLFLQNCNKATLEVVYEMRNCARYTLASQFTLGAPNYYYVGFLESLNNSLNNGYEAATAIIDSEHTDMYHSLTLINNQMIRQIPEKLSRLTQIILDHKSYINRVRDLPIFLYSGEWHCDLVSFFKHFIDDSYESLDVLTEFSKFINSSVITSYATGGNLFDNQLFNNRNFDDACGLGLYVPDSAQAISRYSSMTLYQQVNLLELYRALMNA